jgi:hypothetical protein
MNANNSNITPHKTFPESASQHSPQIKEVVRIQVKKTSLAKAGKINK